MRIYIFITFTFTLQFTVHKISNFQGYFLRDAELWSCAHLHFQLPLLPRNSLLVGMKPLALQPFFFWIQIHFNNFHPISICTISTISFTYCAIDICLRDIAQCMMHHPNCIVALSVARNKCDSTKCWCPHLSQLSSLLLASYLTTILALLKQKDME